MQVGKKKMHSRQPHLVKGRDKIYLPVCSVIVVVIWEMPMHHSFVTPKLFDFSSAAAMWPLWSQRKKKAEIGERNQVLRLEHAMLNQSKQVNNGGCLPPVAATSPSSVVAAVVFPHGRTSLNHGPSGLPNDFSS
jgi:hypothetical protein